MGLGGPGCISLLSLRQSFLSGHRQMYRQTGMSRLCSSCAHMWPELGMHLDNCKEAWPPRALMGKRVILKPAILDSEHPPPYMEYLPMAWKRSELTQTPNTTEGMEQECFVKSPGMSHSCRKQQCYSHSPYIHTTISTSTDRAVRS